MLRSLSLLIVLALFQVFPSEAQPDSSGPLHVAVSIAPWSNVVREIGEQHVVVDTIVAGRADPHTFDLKPANLRSLSSANLIIFNGLGIEFWAKNLPPSTEKKILTIASAVKVEGADPHIWLDPILVIAAVRVIRDRLCELDMPHCSAYKSNAHSYLIKLAALDAKISTTIESWRFKKFIAYHSAWSRFAARYGLVEVGVFVTSHLGFSSPRHVTELLEVSKDPEVQVFFMDAGRSQGKISEFVKDAKLAVVVVDPIGSANQSYVDFMLANLDRLTEVMGK